jgi:ABC-type transporter Mla subunit MlaD
MNRQPSEIVQCRCGVTGNWTAICAENQRGCGTCGAPWPEGLVGRNLPPDPISLVPPPPPAPQRALGDTLRHAAGLADDAVEMLQEAGPDYGHAAGYAEATLRALAVIAHSEAEAMDVLEPRPLAQVPVPPADLDAEAARFGHAEDEDGRCEFCGLPVELWGAYDPVSALCPSRLLEEVQVLRERQQVPRLRPAPPAAPGEE